jgi:hypothetical protein
MTRGKTNWIRYASFKAYLEEVEKKKAEAARAVVKTSRKPKRKIIKVNPPEIIEVEIINRRAGQPKTRSELEKKRRELIKEYREDNSRIINMPIERYRFNLGTMI